VVRQVCAKRGRRALIKQESHLRNLQRARGVLKYDPYLLGRHSGKPSNEVGGGSAVFKVLEQRFDRGTGTTKHPGTTDVSGITFNRSA